MQSPENYHDVLLNLAPGSEVNVHTGKKTYYNAIFKKYNPEKEVAYFLIDQFYEFKSFLFPISSKKIVSMDLPVDAQEVSEEVSQPVSQAVSEEDE